MTQKPVETLRDCLTCEALERRRQAFEARRVFLPIECALCPLDNAARWSGVEVERFPK